ncbi:hypothetical protein CLOM_g11491 [Closterium sp. NIES-68]|nr:hypothetical protein CLOM_g11491 [Closterium sp. NIES-68]GJP65724.1 hypothetical protein CLOP_g22588 [Closterium sp. NIES-67]
MAMDGAASRHATRCAAATPVVRMLLALLLAAAAATARAHEGHDDSESPPCAATDSLVTVEAPYVPGTITVDGSAADWAGVAGQELRLQPAINPNSAAPYPFGAGSMLLKAAHDGRDVFFLLKIPGPYVYNQQNHHLSISGSLMFGIGDDATFYNMGGCPNLAGVCTAENCRGHEVDVVHFEVDTAIPGRTYGHNLMDQMDGTGADRVGNLYDGYGWNPHCRQFDGLATAGLSSNGTAMNDWHGVWTHSTVNMDYGLTAADAPFATAGDDGYFVFELTRPLRTADHFQQDVQLSVGGTHRMGAAVWYPLDGTPWHGSQHFLASCDWLHLHLLPAPAPAAGWQAAQAEQGGVSSTAAAALSGLSLLLALAAVFVSIVVGWWVRANARQFQPMDGL